MKKLLQPSNEFASLMQLMLPVYLYIALQIDALWYWWALAVFFWLAVYTLFGNNIILHRYLCHGHFTLAKWKEYPLLWMSCMIGVGGPLNYAMTHLVHHNPKYTDTPMDPHGPIRGFRSWLICFQKTVDPGKTPIFSRRILELKNRYQWIHDYYTIIVLVSALILYAIDLKVFLFLWAIPASATCWTISIAVWRQHIGLTAQNTPTHRWEIFYEGLHKNHHDYPMAPDTAVRPGEIDWTYQASKLLRPKYNWGK